MPQRLGISGCVRLGVRADAARIAEELARLPEAEWKTQDRDPFVHADVASLHVLGERRGRRVVHRDELPVLASLPALRELLRGLPGRPRRVVVASLRAGGLIPRHVDFAGFHEGTLRLAVCIAAEPSVRFHCDGRWYAMQPGEIWALDNRAPHGAVHGGRAPRIHVIADVEPDEALLALVRGGERELGERDAFATSRLGLRTRLRGVRKDVARLIAGRRPPSRRDP